MVDNKFLIKVGKLIKKTEIKMLLVFGIFFGLNSLIYFSVDNISSFDDQWFYFKIADIFRQGGFVAVRDFQGAFFSDLVQSGYIYGISLFHYFLVPFTIFDDKIFGLKLSGVFLASLAPTIAFFALEKMKCKRSFFWVLIFFYIISSQSFNYRLFLDRNFVLIGSLLLLEIYFISQRKYLGIFLISLIHVWWHPATFWMPIFLIICYELARMMNEKKSDLKLFFVGLGGSLMAFLLYPNNAHSFLSPINPIIFAKKLLSFIYGMHNGPKIVEGMENAKGDLFVFASSNPILFILFIIFLVFVIFLYIRKKRGSDNELDREEEIIFREFIFLVGIIIFLGFLITKRFEDLLIPLILLETFIFYDYIEKNKLVSVSRDIKRIFFISFCLFTFIFLVNRLLDLRNSFNGSPENYKNASTWLMKNTKKGEIIFNTNFAQFPRLYFFNNYNNYIIGIEPKNMYEYDEKLYWLWDSIVYNGVVCEEDCSEKAKNMFTDKTEEERISIQLKNSQEIAETIKNKFFSDYIFVDSLTGGVLRAELEKDKAHFDLAYEDKEGGINIYKIKK